MSETRARRAGGRGGGREGRGFAGRGRGRNVNFNKGLNAFKNPIPSLANHIFKSGSATCPAKFEETWEKLGDRRRSLGTPGAAEVADGMETFTTPTVATPPAPPARIEDPDNMGQQPVVMIDNPNLRAEEAIWLAKLALIPKLEMQIKQQMQAA